MKTEFRNRAFLPVVMPLAIILVVAAVVALFAFILLYNTHEAALVIAVVAAAGILIAVALAASQDELDGPKKAAVFAAGALPVVAGGVFSIVAVTGGVDASLLNINREPHLQVPPDAVIAAQNITSFCLPTEGGGCEDTREWTVSLQEATGLFSIFQFQNLDSNPHNVALFTLADEDVAPGDLGADSGDENLFTGDVITGPAAEIVYEPDPGLEAGKYFFQCSVHPQDMVGVLTVTEGGGGDGLEPGEAVPDDSETGNAESPDA